VPSPTDAPAAGLVRESVAYDRLPWIRPLVPAVTREFERVAPLFAGNPADPDAWRSVIEKLTAQARDNDALATVLHAQLTARGAPTAAVGAAADLASPDAVAIVTGQQAGLF